jgi:Protein of unknown function (DUF2970)
MSDADVTAVLKRTAKKSSLFRSLRAVLCSFMGLRQGAEQQEDMAKLTPLHLMGVGLAVCFVFVIGLMFFVKWVVAK